MKCSKTCLFWEGTFTLKQISLKPHINDINSIREEDESEVIVALTRVMNHRPSVPVMVCSRSSSWRRSRLSYRNCNTEHQLPTVRASLPI